MQHASRVSCLLALYSVLGFAGVGARRVQRRSVGAKMSPMNKSQAQPTEPFDVVFTLLSTEGSIYDKYIFTVADHVADGLIKLLPEKFQTESFFVSVAKKAIEGMTVTLTVQIQDYDLSKVLGSDFAAHVNALEATLERLQMSERYALVKKSTAELVRAGLMTELPAILKDILTDQFVECDMPAIAQPIPSRSNPFQATGAPLPDRVLAHNPKMYYRVEIPDEGEDWVLNNLFVEGAEDQAFLYGVRFQLEQKVPIKIEEKFDGSLKIWVTTQTEQEGVEFRNFGMVVEVHDFEPTKLIAQAKGKAVGVQYARLFQELEYMREQGFEYAEILIENVRAEVWNMAIEGLRTKLPAHLHEMFGAEMWAVTKEVYKTLRDVSKVGRCCSPASEGEGQMFYVDKEMLGGAGIAGTGVFGRSGHCPTINLEQSCKSPESMLRKLMGAVKTHHRSIQDCFDIAPSRAHLKLKASHVKGLCSSDQ